MPRSTANPPKPQLTIRPRLAGTKRLADAAQLLAGPECTNPNPKEINMFRTFTSAAILALTITAALADSTTVQFGDLDLSRPADMRVLNSRIEKAVETACSPLRGSGPSLFYRAFFARCVSNTTARMSARIAALSTGKGLAVASK